MSLPAGWYPVAGDPAGTHRYWNGDEFVTEPEKNPNARKPGKHPRLLRKNEVAGPSTRLLAFFVDVLAPLVILIGLANATGWAVDPTANRIGIDLSDIATAWVCFLVVNHVVLQGFWGVSLGKSTMGLRIVLATNPERPPGVMRALTHSLTTLAVPITVPVTFFLMLMGRRQTFSDLVSSTLVVYA